MSAGPKRRNFKVNLACCRFGICDSEKGRAFLRRWAKDTYPIETARSCPCRDDRPEVLSSLLAYAIHRSEMGDE